MIEEQLLSDFIQRLSEEASAKLDDTIDGAQLAPHIALAEVMLGYLEEAGLVPAHDVCAYEDEEGRSRCRAIAYSLQDGSSRLDIFTAVNVPPEGACILPRADLEKAAHRAARLFVYAVKRDFARFKGNAEALEAVRTIARERERIEEVRVHVLTNALVRDRAALPSEVMEGVPIEFSVWDAERLQRARAEDVTRDHIEVDFTKLLGRPIACLEMKPPPAEYQTFLLVLPGDLIAALYEEYGARLFEFNVRSFLQARGKVNKGMRKTLDGEPERFLAYNNGLTATADEIEVSQWHGETVIHRLKGLQIVNGAQTTASIHAAKTDRNGKHDVSRVAVAMKLTRVAPDKLTEFVPKISEYANTQNPVQMADLSANTPFHIEMERLAEKTWCPGQEARWFYERARGGYQVARARYGTTVAKKREFDREQPKGKRFGKTDVAKYLMSWWGHPDTVSKGSQKNFDAFMQELQKEKGDNWRPDEAFFMGVAALAIVFIAARDVVKGAIRRGDFKSYGANVVTYMVAKLASRHGSEFDLNAVWESQKASSALVELFEEWAPLIHAEIVRTASGRNVTEWAKKEGAWEAIRELTLPIPKRVPPEFTAPQESDPEAIPQDLNSTLSEGNSNIAACCSLDAATWAKIIAWAIDTRKASQFDCKVAKTIAGYAMDGWSHPPSEKQAFYGVRVIEAARRAGLLDPMLIG